VPVAGPAGDVRSGVDDHTVVVVVVVPAVGGGPGATIVGSVVVVVVGGGGCTITGPLVLGTVVGRWALSGIVVVVVGRAIPADVMAPAAITTTATTQPNDRPAAPTDRHPPERARPLPGRTVLLRFIALPATALRVAFAGSLPTGAIG
jgi:hypothetical protein